MAKQTWVNVGGNWKKVKNVWINVGGMWKSNVMPKGKINGIWKEFMNYSIFPPYLYLEGIEGVTWYGEQIEERNGTITGTKEESCLFVEADGRNIEYLWVTDSKINLTNYNSVRCIIQGYMPDVGGSRSPYETFDLELDISSLSGEFYVRINIYVDSFFSTQNPEIYLIVSNNKIANHETYMAVIKDKVADFNGGQYSEYCIEKVWLE